MMNWTSVNDFFAMGGYALYVWGSYAISALLIAIELLVLRSRRRTIAQRLGRIRGSQ